MTQKYINEIAYKIVGCAIEVHKYHGAAVCLFAVHDRHLTEPGAEGYPQHIRTGESWRFRPFAGGISGGSRSGIFTFLLRPPFFKLAAGK